MSTDTGWGTSQVFCRKLEKDHRRSVGVVCNTTRLQTGVHKKAPSNRHKTNFSPQQKFRIIKCGSGRIIRKRCYRDGAFERNSCRFLQHLFPGPQKEWKVKTCYKPETLKQVSAENSFQDGHYDKSFESSEAERLGNLSRLERCISSYTDFSKASEISSFLHSRQVLSMEIPLLRSNFGPSRVYENYSSRSSSSTSPKYQTGLISGGLVDPEPDKTSLISRSREMSQSFDFSRFHNQQRKIKSISQAENNIHRGILSFRPCSSHPNSRQNKKVSFSCKENLQWPKSSKRFPTLARHYRILSRVNSPCSPFHETHPIASTVFLETVFSGSASLDPSYTTSKIPSTMVVSFSKHYERQIITSSTNQHNHDHRCFDVWLWRSCGESLHSRDMVRDSTETTYKLSGVGGGFSNIETFSSSFEKSKRSCKMRQHNCCSVHQQTGRNKVSSAVLQDLGSMEICNTKQYTYQSSSYFRSAKCLGRSAIQEQNSANRMDSAQVCGPEDFSALGLSLDRPICIGSESPDTDILFLGSSSPCSSIGRIVNFMGENVRICLSSHLPNSQGPATYGSVSLSDNSNCTEMATQTLVHRSSAVLNSMSKEVTSYAESTSPAQQFNKSSKSRNFQSSCLATIDRSFQEKGFSSKSRKLLSASWRLGTQKDYSSKFNKFCSWCRTGKIDPYSATLTQVADFLTELFNNGLQYRTIAGYRSMLSAVLHPIGNIPVGQHPYIIRLLKGVFNSRPPSVRILPEWDLPVVLDMLQKQPFEPLSKASLKITTFKTIFLMAISTFRRCGDLQSLKLGEGSVCVQKKGVTFIRHGLAKQDREKHFGSKIFVPAFSENYRLDPKRALYWYLKKTQSLRVKSDGTTEKKIFLALNKPHHPISAQTISNWIVQTIKMAYENKNIKVKAHSTRAVGPSWALYRGASVKSILDAADWSRESTFIKFYLRNVDVQVLKQ